jgi:hypothetical protein
MRKIPAHALNRAQIPNPSQLRQKSCAVQYTNNNNLSITVIDKSKKAIISKH